jgi:hypothetical protein
MLATMTAFVAACVTGFLPAIGEVSWVLWGLLLVVLWGGVYEVAKWLPSKP